MMASTVKNGNDRLRKGNRRRRLQITHIAVWTQDGLSISFFGSRESRAQGAQRCLYLFPLFFVCFGQPVSSVGRLAGVFILATKRKFVWKKIKW